MLLKLAALGTLGYFGYKYIEKNGGLPKITPRTAGRDEAHQAVAGGPLSEDAKLVHAGDPLLM